MINEVISHYDLLADENNDPVHDVEPLRSYMDKWDGAVFIEKLNLDETKSVLDVGVGTGRLAVRTAPLCKKTYGSRCFSQDRKACEKEPITIQKCETNLRRFHGARPVRNF